MLLLSLLRYIEGNLLMHGQPCDQDTLIPYSYGLLQVEPLPWVHIKYYAVQYAWSIVLTVK